MSPTIGSTNRVQCLPPKRQPISGSRFIARPLSHWANTIYFTPNYSIYYTNMFIYGAYISTTPGFIGSKVWNCALGSLSHLSFISAEDITWDLVLTDVLCRTDTFKCDVFMETYVIARVRFVRFIAFSHFVFKSMLCEIYFYLKMRFPF